MPRLLRLQVRIDDSSICIRSPVSDLFCLASSVPLASVPDDFQTLFFSPTPPQILYP